MEDPQARLSGWTDPQARLSGFGAGDGSVRGPTFSERIVDQFIEPGKHVEDRVVSEKHVVGVKPYITVEKIVEVPHVTVKEVTKYVRKPEVQYREVEKPVIEVKEVIKEVEVVKPVEKIVYVPEVITEEKIIHVPKIIFEDRMVEVPKVTYEEKYEYEDTYEYREVPVEKFVEEEIIDYRVVKRRVEKPVPMYQEVDVPIEKEVFVNENIEVHREENVPQIHYKEVPVYKKVHVPMYRAVYPDGTTRIVDGFNGYPKLPVPQDFYDEQANKLEEQKKGNTPQNAQSAFQKQPSQEVRNPHNPLVRPNILQQIADPNASVLFAGKTYHPVDHEKENLDRYYDDHAHQQFQAAVHQGRHSKVDADHIRTTINNITYNNNVANNNYNLTNNVYTTSASLREQVGAAPGSAGMQPSQHMIPNAAKFDSPPANFNLNAGMQPGAGQGVTPNMMTVPELNKAYAGVLSR